ncbi:MAG: carbohydrate kinase, partial [Nitrospiria bacterium]
NTTGICVFGEVLFDHFPDGNKVLGGAPFNLAWHLQAFDQKPCLISRVGDDAPGQAIRAAMTGWGMNTRFLQTDVKHPTGCVEVQLENGEPRYDIVSNCAYDFISDEDEEQTHCQILYHGSLALRNHVSARTFRYLKGKKPERIFLDVNLREPWWRRETVLDFADDAHWVKMNEEELRMLSSKNRPLEESARDFRESHQIEVLVITRAENGALAVTDKGDAISVAPARSLHVIDTVGAGDAFSAVLVLGLSKHWPLALTMERAQAFASLLVARRGATVQDAGFYRPLIEEWQLTAS